MRILVCARRDAASVNIRDRLLEQGNWERSGRTFRNAPVWTRAEAAMVEIEGPSVLDEALDQDLRHTGLPVMDVWFLSQHRAASGQASLTVHPIGNHTPRAEAGGAGETLSPASPRDMGALLRRLARRRDEEGQQHEVTYEATHHGPRMGVPSLFVEIGSADEQYRDRRSGEVVAAAIEDVLGGEGRCDGPVLVGVGFGHYVPRMTARALQGHADFGHLLPHHAVDPDAGPERLRRCIEATPGCEGVYLPRKDLKGPQRQAVQRWMQNLGVAAWPWTDQALL